MGFFWLFKMYFLDYCKEKGVLKYLSNPKSFKYLKEDRIIGIRHLPDFKFKNEYIIEIKSTYIMNLQGVKRVIKAKRNAVESNGFKYLFILDNDFSAFDKILVF